MDDRLMAKSAYYENDRCTTIAVGAAASTEGTETAALQIFTKYVATIELLELY